MQFHFTQDILKVCYCLFWLAINLMKQGSKFLSRVRLHSLPGINDTRDHLKPPSYWHKRPPVTEPGAQGTAALTSLVPQLMWPHLALQDPHPKEWLHWRTFFYHPVSPGLQHNTNPVGDPQPHRPGTWNNFILLQSHFPEERRLSAGPACAYKWLNHPLVSKPRQDLPTFPTI